MFNELKKYIKCDVSFNRYVNFIKSRAELNLNRNLKIYETHHIIPRSMGGTDDADNLIRLTLREHYIAHMMLLKTFQNKEMTYAFITMSGRDIKINSRLYEQYRCAYINKISGENAYWYGKTHSKETIEKLKSYSGSKHWFYGKKHKDESKKLMSINSLGAKNSMYGKFNAVDSAGNIFVCNKSDPRYLSGDLVSIHLNKVSVKDKDGVNMQVDKNDARYLSGELTGATYGMVCAKDINGNRYYISKSDERYISGELIEKNARSCYIKGVFYFKLKHAADFYGISDQTLMRRLRSNKDEWKDWIYTKV